MKEKVIETLKNSANGLRLRELASEMRVNRLSLIPVLCEMESAGIVATRANTDHANGEYYNIWYLVGV